MMNVSIKRTPEGILLATCGQRVIVRDGEVVRWTVYGHWDGRIPPAQGEGLCPHCDGGVEVHSGRDLCPDCGEEWCSDWCAGRTPAAEAWLGEWLAEIVERVEAEPARE